PSLPLAPRLHPSAPLFPYTTLFRSISALVLARLRVVSCNTSRVDKDFTPSTTPRFTATSTLSAIRLEACSPCSAKNCSSSRFKLGLTLKFSHTPTTASVNKDDNPATAKIHHHCICCSSYFGFSARITARLGLG